MTEYFVPTKEAEASFVEKRSEFIGHVWPVDSEEEARAHIEETKKRHYDARHNCWCYLIKDGPVRYSDDGEPQGTAGQPMLGVFQKEGVTNVCCVVTRYFGGILLGAGGLVRAYTQSAKDALDAAGVSVVRRWVELAVECPYSFLERVKNETAALDGVVGQVEYAAGVTVHALLPEERAGAFADRITELSAGSFAAIELGEQYKGVPIR
ncbi:MAG: YigZ family protein [Candidatus Enterenecus sp.]